MSDISKISIPNGDEYDLKDAVSRENYTKNFRSVIIASSPITIPAQGVTKRYDVTGMTQQHSVVKWGFSSSSENSPPCKLTITTYDGYFTIKNVSGSTSETITPIFVGHDTSYVDTITLNET